MLSLLPAAMGIEGRGGSHGEVPLFGHGSPVLVPCTRALLTRAQGGAHRSFRHIDPKFLHRNPLLYRQRLSSRPSVCTPLHPTTTPPSGRSGMRCDWLVASCRCGVRRKELGGGADWLELSFLSSEIEVEGQRN